MQSTLSTLAVSANLFAWIDEALSKALPERTVAFHFNLYEGVDSVHVQLIGTDAFAVGETPERDYWPSSETFTTGEDIFEIPFDVAGPDWRQWLVTSMDMLRSYMATGDKSDVFRVSKGVGVGFVDGDMHVLWQPTLRS
jgi:hypothetical protein